MAVNTKKTKFIVFRTHGKIIDNNLCKIVFNNNEIGKPEDPNLIFDLERVHNMGITKSLKILGVLFDEYLLFDDHINMLCSKVSSSLYIINRAKNFLPKCALLSLYFALIHSNLSYCLLIYGCAKKTHFSKIITQQKKAVRIICNANARAHTNPIFKELKILPIEKMLEFSKLKFMHLYHNNKQPLSFSNMWITNQQRNPERRLRNNDCYDILPHRYESIKNLPLFALPRAWNQEDDRKLNPDCKIYLKNLKLKLLNSLV
jgi:hypothetical protein